MPLVEWNDSYSVKIREMDRQHLQLVQIINDLHEAMLEGKAKDVLAALLGELVNYTRHHFGAEEGYLQHYGYSDLNEQKLEHASFVNKLTEFTDGFESGRFGVSIEMLKFLSDWLLNHIQGTDMKYVPFLIEKRMS